MISLERASERHGTERPRRLKQVNPDLQCCLLAFSSRTFCLFSRRRRRSKLSLSRRMLSRPSVISSEGGEESARKEDDRIVRLVKDMCCLLALLLNMHNFLPLGSRYLPCRTDGVTLHEPIELFRIHFQLFWNISKKKERQRMSCEAVSSGGVVRCTLSIKCKGSRPGLPRGFRQKKRRP